MFQCVSKHVWCSGANKRKVQFGAMFRSNSYIQVLKQDPLPRCVIPLALHSGFVTL